MKFTLETGEGITIRGYGEGHVVLALPSKLSGATGDGEEPPTETVTRSVVLTRDQVLAEWLPDDFDALEAAHFQALLELEPEVILFGSGAHLRFPVPQLLRAPVEQGVGVEVMDTAAACRTFNILVAEGRRVAAALLMI